ncbi:MAG: tRNA (guanine-N7-)-methyltransferase [Gammaproteobacteria bacterium]
MNGNNKSRSVISNQQDVHRDLVDIVQKHHEHEYRRPIAQHSQAAFAKLDRLVNTHGGPIILDSGCGTTESSQYLARTYPEHLVIGIDKSGARLARSMEDRNLENLCIARADCVDLWRLAAAQQWPISHHFLLYPNPWPKAKHVRRRWHGHPVFGALTALGGILELRSNWKIYIAEFELALATLGFANDEFKEYLACVPNTAFERKYQASGHILYRLTAQLSA